METTIQKGWSYISAIFDVLLKESDKRESLIEPQYIFRGITKRHFTTSKTIEDNIEKIEEIFKNTKPARIYNALTRIKNNNKSKDKDKEINKFIYNVFDKELKDYFEPIDEEKPDELLRDVMKMDCLTYAVPEYINSGAVVRMQQQSNKIFGIDFINYNKHMLSDLKNRFPVYTDENYSDIEILADVQHKGAASCLIDFSTNFLTSLWFATQSHPDQVGYLFCYDINREMLEEDSLYILSPEHLNRSIEDLLNETTKMTKYTGNKSYKFWLWKPSNLNERIMMQDSVFIFGLEPFLIKQHKIVAIPIPPKWKNPIQHVLKSFFGVNAESIFYDIDGYAESNSKLKPFVKTYLHYFSEKYDTANCIIEMDELQNGMECLFQSEYELALKYFTLYESKTGVLYNREFDWDKHNRDDSTNYLFGYLKYHALKVDVHYSKGLCLKHLGTGNEYAAIEEFDIAKELCEHLLKTINVKPEPLHLKNAQEEQHLKNYQNYLLKKMRKIDNDILDFCFITRQYDRIFRFLEKNILDCKRNNHNDAMSFFVTMHNETKCLETIYKNYYSLPYDNDLTGDENNSGSWHINDGLISHNKKPIIEEIISSTNAYIKKSQPLYSVLNHYFDYVNAILTNTRVNSSKNDFKKAIDKGLHEVNRYADDNCFTSWDLLNITRAIKEIKRFDASLFVKLMAITYQVIDFINFVQGKIKTDSR